MSSLQEIIPAYVRRKIVEKTKENLQQKYNKNRSLRPTIIEIKNMCVKEGKMKLSDIERLTDERDITRQISSYINAAQDLIDCCILMTVYIKAIGGAERSRLVFDTNYMASPRLNVGGVGVSCILCKDEARTAGAFCPSFGQPGEGKRAWVYLLCGLAHRPPTNAPGDKPLRDLIFPRLKKEGMTDAEAVLEDKEKD